MKIFSNYLILGLIMDDLLIKIYDDEIDVNKITNIIRKNIIEKRENRLFPPDLNELIGTSLNTKKPIDIIGQIKYIKEIIRSKSPNIKCKILGRWNQYKEKSQDNPNISSKVKVHQIIPWLGKEGDAIADEIRLIQKMLQESGYDSEIYCENYDSSAKAKYYPEYLNESSANNILIYHHAGVSRVAKFIRDLPDYKILIYHNITPSSFYKNFDKLKVTIQEKGLLDTKMLSSHIDLALGDSEYNKDELITLGYKNCDILPILLNYDRYDVVDEYTLDKYSDGNTNIIFVGRIAPNKCYEDLIKVFYYYKKLDPSSRLLLPGSYNIHDKYYIFLQTLLTHLNLKDVFFFGKVPQEQINSYYRSANIFLSMSEHEGFCIPLVESMYFGIPIVAFNSSAIPDTLGKSGILINNKNFAEIAELMYILKNDEKLRERIISGQKKQLNNFEYSKIRTKLLSFIQERGINN